MPVVERDAAMATRRCSLLEVVAQLALPGGGVELEPAVQRLSGVFQEMRHFGFQAPLPTGGHRGSIGEAKPWAG